jgi:hypothetical protein
MAGPEPGKKIWETPMPTALPSAQPFRVPYGTGSADGNAVGIGVAQILRAKRPESLTAGNF